MDIHAAQLMDLSHVVEDGMITYQGLPAPLICDYLSRHASREVYAEGPELQIGKFEIVANTGSSVESPFHRYPDGKDLSELPLSSLAHLEGVVVRISASAGRARSGVPARSAHRPPEVLQVQGASARPAAEAPTGTRAAHHQRHEPRSHPEPRTLHPSRST